MKFYNIDKFLKPLKKFNELGLTDVDSKILYMLICIYNDGYKGARISLKDFSNYLSISKNSLIRGLNNLIEKDLICKEIDEMCAKEQKSNGYKLSEKSIDIFTSMNIINNQEYTDENCIGYLIETLRERGVVGTLDIVEFNRFITKNFKREYFEDLKTICRVCKDFDDLVDSINEYFEYVNKGGK